MPLNAYQLSVLRGAQVAAMVSTCAVWRKVKSTNSAGGAADTWTLIANEVPCRLSPEGSRRLQELVAEREALTTYYRLTVPHDTDLQADDQIIMEGDTYQITALWENASLQSARRAVVVRVS